MACSDSSDDETTDQEVNNAALELTTNLCDDPNNISLIMDLLNDGSNSEFSEINQETIQRMIEAPTEGPFYMVNLIRYREWAEYPDGRETDLTGKEANALYAPAEFLAAIGARAVFNTQVDNQIDGDDIMWEDIAQYEPERTGREAWEMYQASGVDASGNLGHYSTVVLEVQGVFTGDDRSWDQIQIVHMSSMAGFQALLDDETRQEGSYHRLAALQHNYSMITFPTLSQIPYASDDSVGDSSLPVTADGTGTLWQTDDDCAGNGVETCIKNYDNVGFCTRQSCETGDCEAPYVCCRECNEAMASMLPFDGSACIPNDQIEQLTATPVSCICD